MATLPVRADSDSAAAAAVITPNRTFVQDVLPFLTSLLLHASIVALGILTYKAIKIVVTPPSIQPNVIPDGVSLEDPDKFKIQAPGIDGPDSKTAQPDLPSPPDSVGVTNTPAKLVLSLPGGSPADSADDNIALGFQAAFGKKGEVGVGLGKGNGVGDGDGGSGLAIFGPRQTGGGTPVFPPSTAKKIIFLCDSSGSMINKFDALRNEIRKSVDMLRANQEFAIIFFSGDKYVAFEKGLTYALPENKRRAFTFLDGLACHGSSDPIPGLRAAFAAGPELVFMLTDGDFPNNAEVLAEVRKLTAGKHVKVNTIAFMDRGEEYEKLLNDIAQHTGGVFKFVAEQDLSSK